jgi:hypothetical protein
MPPTRIELVHAVKETGSTLIWVFQNMLHIATRGARYPHL